MSSRQSVTKSKVEQLARIRDNQRRSRAKKRDYIALLEAKIREYESEPPAKSSDRDYTQRLVRENEQLKGLLKCMGLDEKFQEAFIKASSHTSALAQMAPAEQLAFTRDIAATETSPDSSESGTTQHPPEEGICSSAMVQPVSDRVLNSEVEYTSQNNLQNGSHAGVLDPSLSGLFPHAPILHTSEEVTDLGFNSRAPTPNFPPTPLRDALFQNISSGDCTLCHVAYSVLLQYDRTGASLVELDLKLRTGYSGCSINDCTVDNKVLFSVLAEIS